MPTESCFLTTKDFTILEVMRDRCLGREDPLSIILTRKIETATVVFRDDIAANVATLNSRVSYSVNGRNPDIRIISHEPMASPIGMCLSITTLRGLALLGLSEGQEIAIASASGQQERILLYQVHYQPEAATREKRSMQPSAFQYASKPNLRLIRGRLDEPRYGALKPDGFDDPGPSAA